ncbi:MAG: PAS domain S-box protein [Bryobacterales bacterium]|nr:PAS domain S-box protein [Bryobacterales bacterium]
MASRTDQSVPEGRLAEFIEDLRVIVWEADPSGEPVLWVSSGAEAILGYPESEWLREDGFFKAHLHPEDRDASRFALCDPTHAQRSSYEFRLITADGRVVWMRSSVRTAGDGPGRRLRGVLMDITASKRAEEAFRDSQSRYRYLVEHASEIICKTDIYGRFTFFNPAASLVLKREPAELIGTSYLDLIRPDFRPMVRRHYLRQFLHRIYTTYAEFPALTGDGSYVWLGQNVQLVMDGGSVVGFQGIIRDLTEHKRSQEALLESEERYRIVAETATDAIITVDDDLEILFVNHAAEKIFGYSVEEMLGSPLTNLLPSYPRRVSQASARFDLNTGRTYLAATPVELMALHKEGHEVPVEVSLGEFTEAGRHLFTAVVRDTSERKRAEEALRRSDERFRSLIENASDIVTILDGAGIVRYANPSLSRILGYRTEEVTGSSWAEIADPADRQALGAALMPGPQSSRSHELRFRHKDGSVRVLEAIARDLTADAPISGFLVNLRDITARKHAEEQLWAVNETLRSLIEASPVAIIGLDLSGCVTMWTTAATKLFGWTEDEVRGRPLPFGGSGSAPEDLRMLETLRRGESLAIERLGHTNAGTPVMLSISSAPLRAADGTVCGAVAAVTDITEQRRLEDQLRQAQKMEAVGQLAGGVAHDFNNLLTVIKGYAQLIMSQLTEGSRALDHGREIVQAAERASALTRQLLAFSRRQVIQPRVLDINEVVTNMTKMLRRLIGEHVDLVTELKPLAGRVHIDPGQVEQIVLNLVVNARDAVPPHGARIVIETGDVTLGAPYTRMHVGAQPGPHVLLAVTDNGHGMDAATRSRVFEPFFTTKELGKGTGLGLSTVYGIVKQNHANIWVYSEPGLGTTFKIYFPAVDAGAQHLTDSKAPDSVRGSECILVVEDEDGLRALVRELLEQRGYTVLTAGGRREALEIVETQEGPIHLLLTDVVMPDTNGRALAAELQGLRRHMRVLYMSGYPDSAISHHLVLDQGVAFLPKPFSQESLAAKVREVLDAPLSTMSAAV